MAVRFDDVQMLELRGGGQQDIRVVRSVGLEMLQHDREQIVACKTRRNALRIRCDGHRIRVVNDDGFDLRTESNVATMQQCVADCVHVDDAARLGGPTRHQIRTLQRMRVDRRPAARRQQRTARALAPCAG